MASKRLIYRRADTKGFYGDFRGYSAEGGTRERLRDRAGNAVDTDQEAAKAYDRRLGVLLTTRSGKEAPKELPQTVVPLTHFDGLLQYHIDNFRGLLHPRVTVLREGFKRLLLEFLPAATPTTAINRHVVKQLLQWLRETCRNSQGNLFSVSSRRQILGFLKGALDAAVDAEILEQNPAVGLPALLRPVGEGRPTQFYSRQEMGRILGALHSYIAHWNTPSYLHSQVAFAAYTGARVNEVQAQRWEWVDWERKLVRLHTSKRLRGEAKRLTSLYRTVPLWPELRSILDELWQKQGCPPTGLMFPPLREGTRSRVYPLEGPERGGKVGKALKRAVRKAGLLEGKGSELRFLGREGYRVSFQEFRVTYCAARLQTIEPVFGRPGEWVPVAHRTVELEMGHASEDMVKRIYGRVTEGPQERLPEVSYPS